MDRIIMIGKITEIFG